MCDVVCVLRKDEDEEPKPFPEYICALTGRNGGSLEYIGNVIYFLRAVKANAIIKKSYFFLCAVNTRTLLPSAHSVVWEVMKQCSLNFVDGSINKPLSAEMEKEKGLLNGRFSFKALPDGSLDKNRVICTYCRCELRYHWSLLILQRDVLNS